MVQRLVLKIDFGKDVSKVKDALYDIYKLKVCDKSVEIDSKVKYQIYWEDE